MPWELKIVLLDIFKELISINPLSVVKFSLITWPLEFTKADIPLLEDLITGLPSSIDLKTEWEKCWCGPIEFPNHPSSDILSIKS